MRREAEEEIKRLQAQAEASRLQAELEVKRSIAASRREVDKNKVKQAAQAKANQAAASKKAASADDEKARRTREARAAALRAIGKSEDGLDDDLDEFMGLESTAAETGDAIIVNESQIQQRARDRANLIDPTEVMKVEKKEQKRQWVSDDFIWEATLGYRDDPDVDAVGTPADSVGVENEKPAKAEPETTTANKEKSKTSTSDSAPKPSMFETQDINRNIRPQLDVPARRHKRTFGAKAIIGAGLFLAVISGAGWYFMSGDEAATQLKEVVGQGTQTLTNIKDKVSETIGGLGGEEEQSGAGKTASKPVDEEKMARLRERLESMKADAKAKSEESAKLEKASRESVQPAQQAIVEDAPVSPSGAEFVEPETAAISDTGQQDVPEVAPLETVEDVMNALARPAESEEGGESAQPELEVVESVDSLPIIDEAASPEGVVEKSSEATAEVLTQPTEDATAVVESTEPDDAASTGETLPTEAVAEPAVEEESP
jgi:hypothetical protein